MDILQGENREIQISEYKGSLKEMFPEPNHDSFANFAKKISDLLELGASAKDIGLKENTGTIENGDIEITRARGIKDRPIAAGYYEFRESAKLASGAVADADEGDIEHCLQIAYALYEDVFGKDEREVIDMFWKNIKTNSKKIAASRNI